MSYNLLEGTHYIGISIGDPDNYDAPINADSAPTFSVYEQGFGTALKSAVAMSAGPVTGSYYGSFTLDAASGFEEGKCYRIIYTAVVNGRTGRKEQWFDVDYTSADWSQATIDGMNVFFPGAVNTIADLAAAAGLTAPALRAALGMASANLDTTLATIASYIDTEVGAIKTKTDQMVFDSGNLRSSLKMVNGVAIGGNGSSIPWGP